jgi:predicted ATP-dependent endonuclease of OLD family
MVQLLSLKISNFYSYGPMPSDSEPITFANVNVVVGPNNSGKSNIFRSLKLFIDSLKSRYSPSDKDYFSNQTEAKLNAEFLLSDREAQVLLDFLSLYRSPITPRDSQRTFVHQYKNRNVILKLIKKMHVKIVWSPGSQNYSNPVITYYFPELKITIFCNGSSQVYVTSEIPFKYQAKTLENFPKFLEHLNSDDELERQLAINIRDSKDNAFCIESISLSDQTLGANKHLVQGLLKFADLPTDSGYTLSFSYLIGSILSRAFLFSSGGSIFYRKNDLIENIHNDNKTLSQELRETISKVSPLEPDGWNLAEFLFNLKNSDDPENRKRFRIIQQGFIELFPNLTFDVIYKTIRLYRSPQDTEDYLHYPAVVLLDESNSKQFDLTKVGAGIAESLFLLTAFFGSNESVIFLDEPAVNLHPAQMKALFQLFANSSNQFLVITHSLPLLHNLLFERGASVIYVKRPDSRSLITLLDPKSIWSDEQLYKSSYLIDPRIFFARHVLLTEGETDKYFLEASAEIFGLNADTYEDIVVNAGGKGTLSRYKDVFVTLGVPFVVVADSDGEDQKTLEKRSLAYGSKTDFLVINPHKINQPLSGNVFFFEGKIEQFIMSIDADLYNQIEAALAENGLSSCKPAFMHEFVERLINKSPHALDSTIKPLLNYAFSINERMKIINR